MRIERRAPVALTAVLDRWMPRLLCDAGYEVFSTAAGSAMRDLAVSSLPDVAIVAGILEDMSGSEACWILREDAAIPRHLPILLLVDRPPSPELRVAALRAGVWDFIAREAPPNETLSKISSYVAAKRAFAEGADDGYYHPTTGFRSRLGLARRAREASALMSRMHNRLACVVIEVDPEIRIPDMGLVVSRAARLSDVVGQYGDTQTGVIAPATGADGAVRLAARLGVAVADTVRERGLVRSGHAAGGLIAAGYETVASAFFDPVDPLKLLQRAATAVRHGAPVEELPWLRRLRPDQELIARNAEPGAVETPLLASRPDGFDETH